MREWYKYLSGVIFSPHHRVAWYAITIDCGNYRGAYYERLTNTTTTSSVLLHPSSAPPPSALFSVADHRTMLFLFRTTAFFA